MFTFVPHLKNRACDFECGRAIGRFRPFPLRAFMPLTNINSGT